MAAEEAAAAHAGSGAVSPPDDVAPPAATRQAPTKVRALRMALEPTARVSAEAARQFAAAARVLLDDLGRDSARAEEALSALVCHLSSIGDDVELSRVRGRDAPER